MTASTSAAIRDLDSAQFRARYGLDRFSATVLANRLAYIVEHMCEKLLASAFSPILRDFYDFAATVTGPAELDYPTPVVSKSLILFTGTMTDSIRNTMTEYGLDRLKPGDVIVANDPYRTGTHINDLLFSKPVFFEGRIVAFISIKAHQLDMGGAVPGGFSATKSSIYENGLVLSPRALYREGQPVPETWSLIFDNVRFAEMLSPDMESLCAALDLAERLTVETAARYGEQALLGAMRYICDADAERMETALAALPDGTYRGEALMDCDGAGDDEAYVVKVTIKKVGARAEVDVSGTSRQARTSINATYLDAKTTVGVAFKFLLDPESPFTSGVYRPIDLVIPDGSILSALPPDGVVFAYGEPTQALLEAMFKALAPALGPRAIAGEMGTPNIHNAYGTQDDGRAWVSAGVAGGEHGPWGATREADGDNYNTCYQANGLDVAVEAAEADFPLLLMRREYVADSAGAGQNRGGAAVLKDSLWLRDTHHNLMTLRFKQPTGFGVKGGKDGRNGGVWLFGPYKGVTQTPTGPGAYRAGQPMAGVFDAQTNRQNPEGDYLYFARQRSWRTAPYAAFRYVTNAGGGFGDPLSREPERVLRDVRNGYVSLEGAARDYGVAIEGDPEWDPEGLVLDEAATRRLREERTKQ